MRRILCRPVPNENHPEVKLQLDEAKHLTQVLRLKDGDHLIAIDGEGAVVEVRLDRRGSETYVIFKKNLPKPTQEITPITIGLGILKGDAMSWAIEKLVELGVQRFVPLICERTVVRIDLKGPKKFQERWQRVADQSLKQCGRTEAMEILEPISLETFLRDTNPQASILYCAEPSLSGESPRFDQEIQPESTVLIGPEGGWSNQEIELFEVHKHLHPVTLGDLVLRAETAAIHVASIAASTLR